MGARRLRWPEVRSKRSPSCPQLATIQREACSTCGLAVSPCRGPPRLPLRGGQVPARTWRSWASSAAMAPPASLDRPAGAWDELHDPRAFAREATEAPHRHHRHLEERPGLVAEGLDRLAGDAHRDQPSGQMQLVLQPHPLHQGAPCHLVPRELEATRRPRAEDREELGVSLPFRAPQDEEGVVAVGPEPGRPPLLPLGAPDRLPQAA